MSPDTCRETRAGGKNASTCVRSIIRRDVPGLVTRVLVVKAYSKWRAMHLAAAGEYAHSSPPTQEKELTARPRTASKHCLALTICSCSCPSVKSSDNLTCDAV